MLFLDKDIELREGPVRLKFDKVFSADPEAETVPFFHFTIFNNAGQPVGHINFRVGNTRHVLQCAGHIGYEVLPDHRGASLAYYACKALVPIIRQFYTSVIMTVDPSNVSSIRTIEKLGAEYIGEVAIPPGDPAYASGNRKKRRYQWSP